MLYNAKEVLNMRKLLPITLLIISICVVISYPQVREDVWALIPASSKANIVVSGYGGSRELVIKCFFVTTEILRVIMPNYTVEATDSVVKIINEKLGGCGALAVYVTPYGSQYFWPTSFRFIQGYRQYSLSFSDVMTFETRSAFSGGKLLDGTITNGFIAVPAGIDVTKPFKICYEDDCAQLEPFLLAQPQTISTEQVPSPETPMPPPTFTTSQIDVVITASESEIDILDYRIEKHSSHVKLVGHAKNITANTMVHVTIKGRFLDNGGAQLDTSLAMVADILPNATFEFSISMRIFDPEDVKTLEIYEITTLMGLQ